MTPSIVNSPDQEAPARPTPGTRILIVEDNPTNARLSSEMLTSAGYVVSVVASGEEGLRVVQQLAPALAILDLQMPGMDGLTLARHLKGDPATASIPLIVLTAHAMNEHRKQAMQAGCSAFLTKPVRYRVLLDEVAQVLQSSALTGGPQQ